MTNGEDFDITSTSQLGKENLFGYDKCRTKF